MSWQNIIVSDPKILLGKPTIKGTRLSVEYLVGRLADGWTEEMLLENHPRLTRESMKAVFLYLSEGLRDGLMFQFEPAQKAA